jgi:3-hydroxyacyl-CoA dehydrogenase/enoyl-CoA hydratase/3-hydroxybutyryl-CoA epimerase
MNDLTHFQFSVDEGVATVLMDRAGEPMNTLGPAIFDDVNTILERIETDDSIKAVVWGSAKKDFLVGADIRWFADLTDAVEAEKTILNAHEMFARIEQVHTKHGKPVIAAISGACLGGGMELALCASSRICTDHPKTQLGQPEVQLGVIPAGGGTQRLPALIGIADALDLILTGRPARSRKAKKLGLVDEVVPPELLMEVATKRAYEAIAAPPSKDKKRSFFSMDALQELALETNPVGRNVLFKQAKDGLLKQTKGLMPAPERALEAVRIGIEVDLLRFSYAREEDLGGGWCRTEGSRKGRNDRRRADGRRHRGRLDAEGQDTRPHQGDRPGRSWTGAGLRSQGRRRPDQTKAPTRFRRRAGDAPSHRSHRLDRLRR